MDNYSWVPSTHRDFLQFIMKQGIYGMALGIPKSVSVFNTTAIDNTLDFMGTADVTWDAGTPITALVQLEKSEETTTLWGEDERVKGLLYVWHEDADSSSLSNASEVDIDSTRFAVEATDKPEGMGHEKWLRVYRLLPRHQA